MIPKACKRLAEVDFPIAGGGSRHAAKREKSIPGIPAVIPSTMHLWWARRPSGVVAGGADGAASAGPVRRALPAGVQDACAGETAGDADPPWRVGRADSGRTRDLRRVLLKFIADFANWDNSANPDYLDTARALISAAHPEETPLVVDPFAGGGSIPLEALRLGCEAFASDLNPVACLILKVMLEDIPRHGPSVADELRKAGAEINTKVGEELADLYPKDPDGATPIAYLWARTVLCESPNCGAEIPIYALTVAVKEGSKQGTLLQ